MRIGVARSVSNGAELIAIEKGYFKEHNIKVEIELLDSSANAIALLAQGRLNMIAGGISAGYFNALEKNLPITIVADRVTTPIGHNLMLRPGPEGQREGSARAEGQDHRQQRPRLDLDLRDRQDAGDRRAVDRRRRGEDLSRSPRWRSRSTTRRWTPRS